jgi:UDP-N-acetylmuramoyl-tripeptide--D-alanyl-D-alanine ligase
MMKLTQIAQILHGELRGQDAEFSGVSIDTRTLKPGDLYIALRGENFDGHDFISNAAKAGAVCAIISQDETSSIPTLKVANTRQALAELARFHRQQFNLPIIAVTGSCGKTTTKALLTQVFNQAGKVLSNPSSFNNDIGVPLTLLELDPTHQYAITEMGANHPGEIAFLTHLVHPEVAIITNADQAHLEGFGDVDGVACAKGEIFQGLGSHGVAIINTDDAHADFWKQLAGSRRIITFGIDHPADVSARHIEVNSTGQPHFELVIGEHSVPVQLQLMGKHNVNNAIAAAAAGYALGLPLAAIQAGLSAATAEKNRLILQRSPEGAVVIDDSYNANPLSVRAAIQLLAHHQGERILVIGDMRELGENAVECHEVIGVEAKAAGIEQLYCYGELSRNTANAFGKKAHFFADQQELIRAVKQQLHEQVIVLVKGSRSMRMDQVVTALTDKAAL